MKPFAIILLVLTIAVGTYLNRMSSNDQVMIQDTVESSMAAPARVEAPVAGTPKMEIPEKTDIPL